MSDTDQEAERHLITLAMQYHVAGRCAGVCQIVPVAGNLLHHAIEMVLKALLVRDRGLAGVTKLGHNLIKIWGAAVATYPELDSTNCRRAIEELDRFESLRYPDAVIARGAAIRFGWDKAPPMPTMSVPTYDLVMEDVDELFHASFVFTGKNAEFFLAMLNKEARAALRDRNRYPIG
jgi:hypothetical protein